MPQKFEIHVILETISFLILCQVGRENSHNLADRTKNGVTYFLLIYENNSPFKPYLVFLEVCH